MSIVDRLRRRALQLPAYALNGISVALGVLLVQLLAGAAGGVGAALLASSGAIYPSLADVPTTPRRNWQRVVLAAVVGLVASALVMALRGHAVVLGVVIGLLGFGGSMLLAWGLRAAPMAFVPVLATVFTLASPAPASWHEALVHLGWNAAGAALYAGWAVATAHWLQPRYRALALAGALSATARLLRSRARMLSADAIEAARALPLQEWMQSQVALDGQLQPARDLLLAPGGTPREVAVLLHAIALRDTLLGSELDLDLLGTDAAAERLRLALSMRIADAAGALELLALAVQAGRPCTLPPPDGRALDAALAAFADDPRRAVLAAALHGRARHIDADLAQMEQAWGGAPVALPLDAAALQFFVSPDGWPLAALAPHRRLQSPILRHAIRSGIALGAAYLLGVALPWTSHPHWLVLSVAVVLRGNLDQTLARRDARIAGTMLGCLLVLLFAWLGQPWLSGTVFLVSVGVAHAYVNVRYLVTAVAATVMALLQAHMAHPMGGYAIGERLADTLLGAALAWAFCYVLPAWEQRGLARLVARVQAAARQLAAEALRWPEPGEADVALRLARREFYEAIGAIAASAQRSRAEPTRVRAPLAAMATLLTRSHVLLAQLSAARTLLERRGGEFDAAAAREALAAAAPAIDALLADASCSEPPPLPADVPVDALRVPEPGAPLLPWLERRLRLVGTAPPAWLPQRRLCARRAGRS